MGNPNHDERGRFASGGSGAASGDHQDHSPSLTHRNVSGKAIPRSKVVTEAGGAASVGTGGVGSGGSPATGFRVRAKLKDFAGRQTTTGLRPAARERAEMNRDVDRRHYPTGGDAQRLAKRRVLGI